MDADRFVIGVKHSFRALSGVADAGALTAAFTIGLEVCLKHPEWAAAASRLMAERVGEIPDGMTDRFVRANPIALSDAEVPTP